MSPFVKFRDGTVWKPAYQRNNKSNGQKNLRCFPECTEGKGHRVLFCGRSIKIDYFAEDAYADQDIALCQLAIDAEQTTRKQILNLPTKVMLPYVLNQVIEGRELGRLLRTRTNPMGELMPGTSCDCASPESVGFEFNAELRGWHYSFVGNKGTRSIQHALYAYILRRTDACHENHVVEQMDQHPPIYDCEYKVIAAVRSPSWTISCRRRNKSRDAELPPTTTKLVSANEAEPRQTNQLSPVIKVEKPTGQTFPESSVQDIDQTLKTVEPVQVPANKPKARGRIKFNVRRQESKERVAASGRSIYSSKRCIGASQPEPIQRRKTADPEPSEASNLQNVVFKLLTLVLLPTENATSSEAKVRLFSGHSPATFTLELIDILINWRQRTRIKLHVVSEAICQQPCSNAGSTCFSTYLLRQPRFWHAVDSFVEVNELSSKLNPRTTTTFILGLLTQEYMAYKGFEAKVDEIDGSPGTELSPPRTLPFFKSFMAQPDCQMHKTCLKPVCRHCQSTSPGLCSSPLIGLRRPEPRPDLSFLCFEYQNKCVVDETEALIHHLLAPNTPPETPATDLNNLLNLD